MSDSQIQVYTGDSKGKTTASLGLMLRFLGSGGRVCLIQFDKGSDASSDFYQERKLFPLFTGLTHHATGLVRFNAEKNTFRFKNIQGDFDEAQRGLKLAKEAFGQGYGMIILDELLSLILTDLVTKEEVLELLSAYETAGRPGELVVTGHRTWPEFEAKVDLITEMKKHKHYFDKGLKARKGIEF